MLRLIGSGRHGRLIAAALLSTIILAGGGLIATGTAHSQEAGAFKGVEPRQAQRVIEDFLDRFITRQKEFGLVKFGHKQFSVRAKIAGLKRGHHKDLGVVWVAEFAGAILPSQYKENAKQGYAYAKLRIYKDKNNRVQLLVNKGLYEGKHVSTKIATTADLYEALPEEPGLWKDWGGPGNQPAPPGPIASGHPTLGELDHSRRELSRPPPDPDSDQIGTPQPPVYGGRSRPSQGDPRFTALHAEIKKWQQMFDDAKREKNPDKIKKAYDALIAAQGKLRDAASQ